MTANAAALISCAELAASPECVIIDCRHDLANAAAGLSAYKKSHIAGACHLHTEKDLSGEKTGTNGRHPLPAAETLARTFADCGVDEGRTVVVYDAVSGMFAARCWWLLRWLGHRQTRVLDGGFDAWRAGGYPVSADIPAKRAGDFQSRPDAAMCASAEDILARLAEGDSGFLVDARAAARWRGEVEPIDPVRGRIPGAANRPYEDNLTANGAFQPATALEKAWRAFAPADETIHYCGSGLSACHNILALHTAGLPTGRLYPGSWSEWCAHPDRPKEKS